MLDERGFEIPDNTPVSVPTRLKLPQSRVDQMRDFIRHELSLRAHADGVETFDEANDLDVEGFEDFPTSIYEEDGRPDFDSASGEENKGPAVSQKPVVDGAEGDAEDAPKDPPK